MYSWDSKQNINIINNNSIMGLTTLSNQTPVTPLLSTVTSYTMPSTPMTNNTAPKECAGCGKRINERFLLKALNQLWHEDCLKCGCCDCRLGEVGSTLYIKANLILCKRDYLRLFGNTGYCSACKKMIPAFEMVMKAKKNVYHLECFACQSCNHRFCVGDRFYLCDNKILCEYDYEERLVFAGFANIAHNPSTLQHIRRQVSNLQPADPCQPSSSNLAPRMHAETVEFGNLVAPSNIMLPHRDDCSSGYDSNEESSFENKPLQAAH